MSDLRFKECPEFVIEMISSKLDKNDYQENGINDLWRDRKSEINSISTLKDAINEIISYRNKQPSIEYFNIFDLKYK